MAFDGLVLAAVRSELEQKLLGGRINKIYQPEREEIVLHIRTLGENVKLVLSAHAQRGRVHLTAAQKENPLAPPTFCMLLRKYLEGGKIIRIEQPELDRIIKFYIEAYDELGRLSKKILLAEIMGKHSNIILLDPETNTILDGIKRYSHALSRHREVLPGREYLAPPTQSKYHPAVIDLDTLQELLLANPLESRVVKGLLQIIDGLSPESCREVLVQSGLSEDLVVNQCGQYEFLQLWQTLRRFGEMTVTGQFSPTLLRDLTGQAQAFSALDLQQYPGMPKEHATMNQLLDIFYTEHRHQDSVRQQKQHLEQVVNDELTRLGKKIALQDEILMEAEAGQTYKLFAELLTANMYQLSKGLTTVTVTNYYDPDNAELTIPLDTRFTPSQQVQYFYKKYNKAKTSAQIANDYKQQCLEECRYLTSVQASIEQATTREDLAEVKLELGEEGYLKAKQAKIVKAHKNGKAAKVIKKVKLAGKLIDAPQPMEFQLSEDFIALVGKNNRQNDYLTLKIARPEDLWLHVKEIAGSHVIIRSHGKKDIPEAVLLAAAQLAAYYSQGRFSGQVPVDYTLKKYVRKPKGAKPGMVIYEQNKTLYVTPANQLL